MTRVVNIAQSGGNNVTMRNRIINGGMQVNQRGGTISASGTVNTYSVDRFAMRTTSGSVVASMEQSTVAPSGFYNSLLCTITTADTSLTTGDLTTLFQKIEGVNVSDLGWGTASAQSVTLSFQVRSSVTGTYGVGIQNDAGNRSYPSTYTINAANTWETKTITIPGDTTGTWNLGTTSTALYVFFSLAAASNYQGTANAWAAADYRGTTGQVNWGATVGNTFYITGVQLEAGTTATPFEQRLYGTELQLCQRYYQKSIYGNIGGGDFVNIWTGYVPAVVTAYYLSGTIPVQMRTYPTMTLLNTAYDTTCFSSPAVSQTSPTGWRVVMPSTGTLSPRGYAQFDYTLSAEL